MAAGDPYFNNQKTIYGGPGVVISDSPSMCQVSLYLRGDQYFLNLESKVRNLESTVLTLQKKLCILDEDPAKLEQYQSLKNAYNEYKVIERLVYGTEDNGASK